VQRFKRLQHLLEKSSVYSKFMLQQMERQKEEEKSKSSRKERRKKQVNITARSVRTALYVLAILALHSVTALVLVDYTGPIGSNFIVVRPQKRKAPNN